jgi:hypothetical protein
METLRGLLMGIPIGNSGVLALAWCAGIGLAGYLRAKRPYGRRPDAVTVAGARTPPAPRPAPQTSPGPRRAIRCRSPAMSSALAPESCRGRQEPGEPGGRDDDRLLAQLACTRVP